MERLLAKTGKNLDPLARHLKEVVDKTWNFSGRLKDAKDHTLNAVIGLASEAGEVLDEHKKLFFHTAKDRTEAIKYELGDVCYYLAKVIDLYDFTLEEILEANKAKLFERHGIKE